MTDTMYGKIEGLDRGTYMEYRGVPYAMAPVGELRWRAPQRPQRWEGVYEAVMYTPQCAQWSTDPGPQHEDEVDYVKEFHQKAAFERPMSEDCLYLHMWVPKDSGDHPCPVAVWYHGGAFMGGYGSEIEFDGKAYAERGVILVSVDYRCNIFGFFAHPWLSRESGTGTSGNYGILDQIAALEWVYDNIAAFGGDPDNITVFGQSAGAMSVQTLVSTQLTGRRIAKAIMQSGGSYGAGLHQRITLAMQESYGEIFAELAGVHSLEELRQLKTAEVIQYGARAMARITADMEGMPLIYAPTIDGVVLEDDYYTLMDQGKIKDIPYMIGSTKDDICVTPDMVNRGKDGILYQGVRQFAEKLLSQNKKGPYVYYFAHDLPGDGCGAFHSAELWYMFGTLHRCWRPMQEEDYALSGKMLDYWTNFMKTGDPDPRGVWKEYRAEEDILELK